MMCETCACGITEEEIGNDKTVTCPECESKISKLLSKQSHGRANCIKNNKRGNLNKLTDNSLKYIEIKFENIKTIGDQIRETLDQIDAPKCNENGQMMELTLTIDSNACGNVFDPKGLPGYPLIGTQLSKQRNTFFTALGDPIPHLGEKKAAMHTQRGTLKAFTAQRATMSKPCPSVKEMT